MARSLRDAASDISCSFHSLGPGRISRCRLMPSLFPPKVGGSRSDLAFDSPIVGGHTALMSSTLPIGDFSRATHLSVKMLRHYHKLGLLEPIDVDVDSGYRRYAPEQIVTAQVIRRFRDL